MKFLSNLGANVKRVSTKGMLKARKHSPEILLVCGVVTFVGTVMVSCKQTMKCEEVLDAHERRMKEVEDCLEIAKESDEPDEQYSEEDAKKDRGRATLQTGVEFAKLYTPAIVLGAISITCFCASYGIMRKRNIAIGMAYGALEKTFSDYRTRVREELGEDADKRFRYGFERVKNAKILTKNEAGEEVVEERDADVVPWDEGDGVLNEATFVFAPETSKYYQRNEILDDLTIQMARNNLQVDFDIYGIAFLNDALEKLGIKKVPYGQRVGWAKGHGDPYIDFRPHKVYRPLPQNDPIRNPLGAQYECIYEFDFNTCGEVWQYL